MTELEYDHEHPCPSRHCMEVLRKQGHPIPTGTDCPDCCVCWAREAEMGNAE